MGQDMPSQLETQFHESMLNIYRAAKAEAKYNAQRFLQMVVDHGGLEAARMLIHSTHVSEGYVALWERSRLDLTVEAMIVVSQIISPADCQIIPDHSASDFSH